MLRIAMLLLLCLSPIAGCGNVQLWGEAQTAAETSVADALNAANRATADPTLPAWTKAYLGENFYQWRSFVRSDRHDGTWGPKLAVEMPSTQPATLPVIGGAQ